MDTKEEKKKASEIIKLLERANRIVNLYNNDQLSKDLAKEILGNLPPEVCKFTHTQYPKVTAERETGTEKYTEVEANLWVNKVFNLYPNSLKETEQRVGINI